MDPFETLTARAIPFGADNVDTDLIIPATYLKSLTREGLGRGAFEALRDHPENVFDTGIAGGAKILIAGDNFGCGSSREHAPWALLDLGLRVVIAESFADIFAGNAFKNGLLTVALPREAIDRLMALAAEGQMITVDLENQVVTTPHQDRWRFEIDPFRKQCLIEGLDEIALTEAQEEAIAAHEAKIATERPWIGGAARRG